MHRRPRQSEAFISILLLVHGFSSPHRGVVAAVKYEAEGQRATTEQDGWTLEVDLSIKRQPPVFGKRDDAVPIFLTVAQFRNLRDTVHGTPPLRAGKQLVCTVYANGQFVFIQKLNPLHQDEGARKGHLGSAEMFHFPVAGLVDEMQFDMTFDVTSDGVYETLDPMISFFMQEDANEESSYASPQTSGFLASCLRERLEEDACWKLLRSRLYSVPFHLTQPTLAMLAMASPTFFGQNNDGELRKLFPPHPIVQQFRKCAVVGSAGHLRGSQLGREIDTHDAVMRFNEAPVAGFEHDVGSRTTHRVVHASDPIRSYLTQSWYGQPGREQLLYYLNFPNDLKELLRVQKRNEGVGVFAISPWFVNFAWDLLWARDSDKIPTSGFIGIVWALQFCEEVSTYGFGQYRGENSGSCGAEGGCTAQGASTQEARRERILEYRYFDSFDNHPWSYGHKWSEEEVVHQQYHDAGFLKRRFDA